MIDKCAELNFNRVKVHALLDGRDVERGRRLIILFHRGKTQKISSEKGLDYAIASGGGRMKVTMDRYNSDWNIVKRDGMPCPRKGRKFRSASDAVKPLQGRSKATDQYLPAFVITDDSGMPNGTIKDGMP